MKVFFNKIGIALIIFIISTILIYMTFTINKFLNWCNENQISLFNTNISDEYILKNIDKNKLDMLGENIGNYARSLEENKENIYLVDDHSFFLTENGESYAIAEHYNPIGYSIWSYLQGGLSSIFSIYIKFSIFVGLAISFAYIIITNKKINNILKFAIGYFGVALVIPQLYFYSVANQFGGLDAYKIWNIWFYVFYTLIFIIIFVTNYIISANITSKLNQKIKEANQK